MADLTAIVDLVRDVYPHLNMGPPQVPTAATAAKLQGYIDAATVIVEDIVGHVIPVTLVGEVYDGGDTVILLRETPVLEVTSIVEVIGLTPYTLTSQPVGHSVDNYGFSLDVPADGRVTRRGAGGTRYPFYANDGNISVDYTAGCVVVAANVRLGTLELIAHWWRMGQEAMGRVSSYAPGSTADDNDTPPSSAGYLVPNRVKELLNPSLRPLVIA